MSRYINVIVVILLSLFVLGLIFGVKGDDARDYNENDRKQAIKYAQSRLKEYMRVHPIQEEEWGRLTSPVMDSIDSNLMTTQRSIYEGRVGFYSAAVYISCTFGAVVGTLLLRNAKKQSKSPLVDRERDVEE